MKKIVSIVAFTLTLILIACTKSTTTATIKVDTITPARTSVYVGITVEDEKEEITPGTILGRVSEKGVEVITKAVDEITESNEEVVGYKFEATGLKVGFEYELEIFATVDKKRVVFYKGTFKTATAGSSDQDPKYIKTVEDFLSMENDATAYYKLDNDLDFKDVTVRPMFIRTTRFEGHLDGGGFSLNNITIDARSTYTALFGRATGSIANLTINNMTIQLVGANQYSQYISFLVGRNSGQITNVSVVNSQIETHFTYSSKVHIGGLMAYGDARSKIVDSSVEATFNIKSTTQGEYIVGGLVGFMNESQIENATANVDMTISNAYRGSFGGAIGHAVKTGNGLSEIKNSISTSSLTLSTTVLQIRKIYETQEPEVLEVSVGGFIGKAIQTKMASNVAEATIKVQDVRIVAEKSSSKDLYVIGGFAGSINGSSLDNIYHKTTITSEVEAADLTDHFDHVYIGGTVGISFGSTLNKTAGELTVDVQKLSDVLQVTPGIGRLISFKDMAEFEFIASGDYFEASLNVVGILYENKAVLVMEIIREADLPALSITDYYTSEFIKTYLEK